MLKPIAATLSLTVGAVGANAAGADWLALHEAETRDQRLQWVEKRLERPDPEPGLHYLHGRLLQEQGRLHQATRAFATSIRVDPPLAPWSRLALAELVIASDHPETAVGLLVPLLSPTTTPSLRMEAAALLGRVLTRGGDCDLLDRVPVSRLPREERRMTRLAEARCAARQGDRGTARGLWIALLREGGTDLAAHRAAAELGSAATRPDAETALLLARIFAREGRHERILELLPALAPAADDPFVREARFLQAEARLALGEPVEAARAFGELGRSEGPARERSRAAWSEGRALLAAGRQAPARAAFARAARYDPTGPWAGRALFAIVELAAERGEADEARRILDLLAAFPQHTAEAGRAALLLVADAANDGRSDRLLSLLLAAHRVRADPDELRYWEGRADLMRGRPGAALSHFLALLRESPWHPLALDAISRLRSPSTRQEVASSVERWIGSPRTEDRLAAWYLLPPGDPRRERVERSLYQRFVQDPRAAGYLSLAPVPPNDWPLWDLPLDDPLDRLLALGRWSEVPPGRVIERFPPTEPGLAYTAARRLAANGRIADSIRLAELLEERAREAVPTPFLPLPLRQILYPTPSREAVLRVAGELDVDPALVFAILREAGRFDPRLSLLSGPSALEGFPPPVVERLALRRGITPSDDPEPIAVAGELLAARLAELAGELDTAEAPFLILALHEGVPRTTRRLAGFRDLPELLAGIGDGEGKRFLEGTLTSLAAYRSIWPELEQ